MYRSKPIIWGGCEKDTGYTQEQFMYYVATSDVLCPHCGHVIIRANNGIEFSVTTINGINFPTTKSRMSNGETMTILDYPSRL